jgi:predicted DNA-binding protein (UPF0251 family)
MVTLRTRKKLQVNGHRYGQERHGAQLTNHEVELIRQLHEQGMPQKDVAAKFEKSRGYVSKIVNFRKRQRG